MCVGSTGALPAGSSRTWAGLVTACPAGARRRSGRAAEGEALEQTQHASSWKPRREGEPVMAGLVPLGFSFKLCPAVRTPLRSSRLLATEARFSHLFPPLPLERRVAAEALGLQCVSEFVPEHPA